MTKSEETPDASPDASPTSKASCLLEHNHPHSFYCPISKQCMHDPVVLSDGHSYERLYIEKWLTEHSTSPRTGALLESMSVIPNIALRNAIEEYFAEEISKFRRVIQQTIARGPQRFRSIMSNKVLLRTVEALMQCSILVNEDLNIEYVLQRIMDEARALLGAEAASVFLLDRKQGELYSTVNSTGNELRIPISSGIAGHVASTGEYILIPDAYDDERFDKSVDAKTGFRTRSILCMPIKTKKGVVLGVVQIINKINEDDGDSSDSGAEDDEDRKCGFTVNDQQLLQVFASQAATCLVNNGFVSDLSSPKAKAQEPSASKQIPTALNDASDESCGVECDASMAKQTTCAGLESDEVSRKWTSPKEDFTSCKSACQDAKPSKCNHPVDESADIGCSAKQTCGRGAISCSLGHQEGKESDAKPSDSELSACRLADEACIDTSQCLNVHYFFASPLCRKHVSHVSFDRDVPPTDACYMALLGVDFDPLEPGRLVNIKSGGELAKWNAMQEDEANLVRPDDKLLRPIEVTEPVALAGTVQVKFRFFGMRGLERLCTEKELQTLRSTGCNVIPRVATIESLRELVSAGTCLILNLSLHCCSQYLLFEDMQGQAHPLSGQELQELLSIGQVPQKIRLVFLGACRSLAIGHHIVAAGVQHVVCVGENDAVLDSSCHLFEKHFFLAIGGGKSVREAFDCGVQVLKCHTSKRTREDAFKFVLLPEFAGHSEMLFSRGSTRTCFPDSLCQNSKSDCLSGMLPAQVEDFLGRDIAVHRILLHLTGAKVGRRCVVIVGDAGIGKSALMLEVGHFTRLRPNLFEAVHWLSHERLHTCQEGLEHLRQQLEMTPTRRILLLYEAPEMVPWTSVRRLLSFPGVHVVFTATSNSSKIQEIQMEIASAGVKPVCFNLAPLDALHQAHLFLRRAGRALRNSDLEFDEVDPCRTSPSGELMWRPKRPLDYLRLASSRLVKPHAGNLHQLIRNARNVRCVQAPRRRHTVHMTTTCWQRALS